MQRHNTHRYDDIIDLPHHVSSKHPQMSIYDRAAQFSAFKALTGYEDAVTEAGRLTGEKVELDEASLALLDTKMQILREKIEVRPEISVTYFVPDLKKDGGEYQTVYGNAKKIDEIKRMLLFTDGNSIPIDEIIEIDGDLFKILDKVE